MKTGDAPEQLAKNIGIDPVQLKSTLDKWNADVADGKDTVFHKTYGLKPIAKAPFYAVSITEKNLGSCGGLKIDTRTRVMDVSGKEIPRLYACGMVTGGYIGPYYPGSGTALAATVCFGRIAGKHAADEKPLVIISKGTTGCKIEAQHFNQSRIDLGHRCYFLCFRMRVKTNSRT